ncbi:phage terminase large subunit [Sphingobium tyrosinilyticum]|uniref:Phage terminase large subunit n=1 Tax=Sphingobium tyrosinilyticum TaxID=2715436 RepID=A0ABV9F2Y9_9SPHN
MADSAGIDNPDALLKALMGRDFGVFLRKAYPAIRGGDLLSWNWHLDAIAHALDQVTSRNCRHLLITMPPRNLKSLAISVAWVAWQLGRDPRQNFVCVSYSNDLAAKLARDCLAIMQQGWYRELFPRTILSAKRTASTDFETTMGGGRLATSITGTLTGRGGDIIIIDDPIKPEEANSDTSRNAVNDWFKSTLSSRLNDKASGAIITVMQRLHQYDLAGMLLESGEWTQLSLPAIATEEQVVPLPRGRVHLRHVGDVLHPDRESLAVLEAQKLLMGSQAFMAQYQQDPVPASGNLVQVDWLRTYPAAFFPHVGGQVVQSWDTASKEGRDNDFSVCITAHVLRSEIRILHIFRQKLAFPELKRHAIRLAREHGAHNILIEDQASGTQLIQTLRSEQPRGVPLPIARRPEGDKYSRLAGACGQIEAGQLFLPEEADWKHEFIKELLAFPNGRHDDQADALSQLMNWALRNNDEDLPVFLAAPIVIQVDDSGEISYFGGRSDRIDWI